MNTTLKQIISELVDESAYKHTIYQSAMQKSIEIVRKYEIEQDGNQFSEVDRFKKELVDYLNEQFDNGPDKKEYFVYVTDILEFINTKK